MEGQNLKDLFSSYGLRSSLANELEKRDIKTVGKLGRVWRRSPRDLDFAFNLARIDETKLKNAFDTAAKQYEQSIKSHGDTNYVTPTTPHSSIREKEKQPQQSQPVVKKSPPSSSKIEVTYPPIPSTIFRATQPQPPSDPKPPYQSRPSKDSSAHTTNVDHTDTMAKAGKHQHFQPKLNGKSPEYNVDESMNYGKRQPSEKSNFHPPVEVVLPNPQQSEQDYSPSSPPLSYDLNKRSYPRNQPFSNPNPNYVLEATVHSSRLEEATKMLKVIEINVSGLRDRKPAEYDSRTDRTSLTSNPHKLSDIAPPFQSLRKPSMMPEPPPEKETKVPTAPVSCKVPADSVSRPLEILTRRASEPLPAWGPNSIANDGVDSNRSALTEMQLRAQHREQAESNQMNQSKYDYQGRNLTTNDSLTTKKKEAWVTPYSTSSLTTQVAERTILAQPYYLVDGNKVASQTSPVLSKPVSYANEDRAANFEKNTRNEDPTVALGNFGKQAEKLSSQTKVSSFIDRHQSITESASHPIKYPQTAASAPITASLPHQYSDSSQSTKASMTTFESSSPNNAPRPPPLVNPELTSDSIPVQVSLRSAPQPPAQPEPYRAPSILSPSTVNTETITKSDKSDGDQGEAFFTLLQAYSISSEIIEKCKAFEVQSLPKLLSLDTNQINRLASTVKPIPKKKFEAFLQAAREGRITGDPNLTGPLLSPLLTGTKTPTAEPATQYVTNPPTTKGATESNQESEGISGDLVIMGAEELLSKEELQQQLELENELLENLIQLTVNQAHQFSKPALEVLNQSKLDHQERAKRLKRLIQLKGGKTPLRGGRGGGGGVGGGSDLMNPVTTPPLSSASSARKVNISNKITTYSVNGHHFFNDIAATKRTAPGKLTEKGGSSKGGGGGGGGGRAGRDVGYGDIDNLPDYSNGNGNDNNRNGNSAMKTVRSNGSSTSGNEGNGATITKERSITEEQRLKEKQRIEELERNKMSNNASNSWKCSLCQRLNDPAVVQCPDCFTPRDRPTLSSRSVSTGRVMTRSQTNTELGIRNSRAVEGLTDYHPTYSATDFYNSNGYPSSSGSTYSMKRQLKHCRRCNNPGYEGSRCTQCSYFL